MNKSKILYIFCLFRVGVGAFVITSVFCTLIYTGFYALAAGLLLVSGIIFYYRSLIGQTINNNLQQQTSDYPAVTDTMEKRIYHFLDDLNTNQDNFGELSVQITRDTGIPNAGVPGIARSASSIVSLIMAVFIFYLALFICTIIIMPLLLYKIESELAADYYAVKAIGGKEAKNGARFVTEPTNDEEAIGTIRYYSFGYPPPHHRKKWIEFVSG